MLTQRQVHSYYLTSSNLLAQKDAEFREDTLSKQRRLQTDKEQLIINQVRISVPFSFADQDKR